MDGSRFDGWTKAVAVGISSRRRLTKLAAGAGLAVFFGGAAPAAARCRAAGKPCLTTGDTSCCSGQCRPFGSRGLGRCQARPAAKGCTIRDNSCAARAGSFGIPCPRETSGRCFLLRNGLPFCATQAACFHCTTNDDCNRHFRRSGGRCIHCESCGHHDDRFCIFP